mmetsp:Transcript_6145/g.9267  ORF Transcript_6145/g.9267 Transcript_6145/m.9267 type:complete len:348 (-) Transcript_6145:115-1158(-)
MDGIFLTRLGAKGGGMSSWKPMYVCLQGSYIRFCRRPVGFKEMARPTVSEDYLNDIFLQAQIPQELNLSFSHEVLENPDHLLERHTVICCDGRLRDESLICWELALRSDRQKAKWVDALYAAKRVSEWVDMFNNTGFTQCDDEDVNEEISFMISMAIRMMGGVSQKDRFYYLKRYSSCFIGSEAISWIMKDQSCSESDAITLGNRMLSLNLIYHVVREHMLCNDYYFYRFNRNLKAMRDGESFTQDAESRDSSATSLNVGEIIDNYMSSPSHNETNQTPPHKTGVGDESPTFLSSITSFFKSPKHSGGASQSSEFPPDDTREGSLEENERVDLSQESTDRDTSISTS